MVAALRKAFRLRAAVRGRTLRVAVTGRIGSPSPPLPDRAVLPNRGLTAQELIRMARAARRGERPAPDDEA